MKVLRSAAALPFAVALIVLGCGGNDAPPAVVSPSPIAPPTSPSPTPAPAPTTGVVQGTIRDFDTGAPVAGVTVQITVVGNTFQANTTTDARGGYRFELSPRQFSVLAFRGDPVPGGRGYIYDYLPGVVRDQQIAVGDTLTIDFALKTRLVATSWTITGMLVDRFSHPIPDAPIYVHDPADTLYRGNQPDPGLYGTAMTDKSGRFVVTSRARVETPTIEVTAYTPVQYTITPPLASKAVACCNGDVFLASPLLPENR